jgi:ABC-type transport system involved in multi-copper enzyme maturation permease subunit
MDDNWHGGNWRQWWRGVRQSPIYQRERGGWGKPNPYYDHLSRYLPFVVLAALFFGLCGGMSSVNNLFAWSNESAVLLWCLTCLPGILLSMLTLFGVFMAPALTAPMVSMEVDRGSWDLLRLTPLPTRTILAAKLLGALDRLRIWLLLFLLTLLQGSLVAFTGLLYGQNMVLESWALAAAIVFRPWLEIFFSAIVGLYASITVSSATTALVVAYTAVILMRLFNNTPLWLAVANLFNPRGNWLFISGNLGPTAVYLFATIGLAWSIRRWANRQDYSA